MQRRNVIDIRRQSRNMDPVGSGVPAFSGVIDDMVSAGLSGSLIRFAGSTSHRLYTSYTSNLIRVRRTDNVEANIPYAAGTNRLDIAGASGLATFCGAQDGFIVTVFDQTGLGLDVTQPTPALQPKIYDSATGTVLRGSLPYPSIGGLITASPGWSRADSIGITGATAVSHLYFGHANGGAAYDAVMMGVGSAAGANLRFDASIRTGTDAPSCQIGGSNYRSFTASPAITTPGFWVHRIAAGAQIGASTCRENGVDLAQSAVGGGTNTTNINNVGFSIGRNVSNNAGWLGGGCAWICLNADVSGAPLTAAETFGASLLASSV